MTKRYFQALAAGVGFMAAGLATSQAHAISAGCAAASTALSGAAQNLVAGAAVYAAGDVLTITNSTTFYTNMQVIVNSVVVVNTTSTTATYTIPSAGSYAITIYSGVSNGAAVISVSTSCTPAAAATATGSGTTVATNAKQSTQYVAPKVMATATTAIGTLIGNNIKGAFSRVGAIQGRATGAGFAASDPAVIFADASNTVPPAAAVGDGLRKGLLDGRLGGFAEMSYTHLRSTEAGGQYSGSVKNGVAGIDYLLRPDLLVGIAAGYEFTDFTTTYNSGWLDGQGLTIAPYFGYSFGRYVLDVTLGHSWLEYESLRGTGSTAYGSYNASRNFITGNLTATYHWQELRLAPSAGLLFARETADAYTDSRGVQQEQVSSQMGRVSLGGEIGRPLDMRGLCMCSIEPFVKAKLNHDFLHDGQVVLANGQLSAVHDITGQVGGGVRMTLGRYLVALVDSSYDTLGAANLDGWNVRGRLDFTLPF